MYIDGFENRSVVCRWEKILKMRCRGIEERSAGFWCVSTGIQPGKKGRHYEIPTGLDLKLVGEVNNERVD